MKRFLCILVILALIVVVTSESFAAKAKNVKKKSSAPRVVQGTTQLSGENAKFGTTYTLGKTDPFNITLVSAEYTVGHVQVGDTWYIPNKDEKLLILHLMYHNPRQTEYFVRWDTFRYTIVDSKSQNHEGLKALGAENTKARVEMSLKPAQKIGVYGVMIVPAAGEMPKLMITSSDDKVLRYDLRGKVKGLVAPFADPADKSGATALATVQAQPGVAYSIDAFTFQYNGAESSPARVIDERELEENERYYIVRFTLKNVTNEPHFFRWDSLVNSLTDTDGINIGSANELYLASKDRRYESELAAGQEISFRYTYKVPQDSQPKSLQVAAPDLGREFVFDLSGGN